MKKSDNHKHSLIGIHIDQFIESFKNRNYSKSSIASYHRSLLQFKDFIFDIDRVQDVTFEHINAWRLHLLDKYALSTTDLMLRSVRLFFRYLEESHHIFVNPAKKLITPKFERKLLPVPSDKEVKRLLMQPDTTRNTGIRDRAILEITYTCGVRLEELWNLTIFDPDIKQSVLRVKGKGNKERVLPLGKQSMFWLKQYMVKARSELVKSPDEQALWLSIHSGKKLCKVRIQQMFGQYAKKARIKTPVSAHSLRRACATHMLNSGAHPVQIQMLLGHCRMETLSQYLRVTITDMKKMHKKSRLGR